MVVEASETGPFGSQLHASDYVDIGIPSIMPVNIGDNRLIEAGIKRITREDAQRLSKHLVRTGDIIYSRRGDVERRAIVREAEDGWFCGTGCLKVRLGEGVVDPDFASHYLGHPAVREWIVNHAVGATMPNLNTGIMESVPFVLPPLPEQRAIAEVLGSLDDKIELNRRMNRTLESIARARFRHRFLDDASEDGEDGTLADLLHFERETVKVGDFPEETFDHYSLPAFDAGREPVTETGDGIKSNKFAVPSDAVLMSKLNPRIPRIWMPTFSGERRPICSTEFLVACPTERVTREWLYCLLTSHAFSTLYRGMATGTTGSHQRVNAKALPGLAARVPSAEAAASFTDIARPLFSRINSNLTQSRTLAALRDALLPHLLSGGLPVDAVASAVEAA